jgi:hypothetical protein
MKHFDQLVCMFKFFWFYSFCQHNIKNEYVYNYKVEVKTWKHEN